MRGAAGNPLLRALLLSLAALPVLAVPAEAGTPPKLGTYEGTISTNAPGNKPQTFTMTVTHTSCRKPGSGALHKSYCATVQALSIVQTPCPSEEFVDDAFFPVSEPVALSPTRKISHNYPLYQEGGGQIEDHFSKGETVVGHFEYSLSISTHGTATGKAHLTFASGCDSGPLTITAKRKR